MKKIIFICCAVIFISNHKIQAQTSDNSVFGKEIYLKDQAIENILVKEEIRSRIVQLDPDWNLDFSKKLLLNLFSDINLEVKLNRLQGRYPYDLQVWTGRTQDTRFDHLTNYVGTTLVYNPHSKKMVITINERNASYQIIPTSNKNQYRIRQYSDENFLCNLLPFEGKDEDKSLEERIVCGSSCAEEKDENGKYVVDILIGYSNNAAAAIGGEINAHALSMVMSVNNGLNNSLITSTYMRLVGTALTPNNPGVVTSVLNDCYTWFAPEIENLAPDYVGVFQTYTNAPNEAGGWAGVGGFSNVNGIAAPAAFRHEVGHNVGGGHCPGDGSVFPYAHGFNNGNGTTHLCGNGTNFYSNPNVNDGFGVPIGDAATADMARTWNERAPIIAINRLHRVPYSMTDTCYNQICLPSHWGGQLEVIKRVVLNTLDNDQTDPSWTCPSIIGYSDFTHLKTTLFPNILYNYTVTPNYSYNQSKFAIWCDWNNNGIFSQNEKITSFSGQGPWSGKLVVPSNAALGTIRMRLRLQYGEEYIPVPCDGSGYSSGETEDYTLIIATFLPIELYKLSGQSTKNGNLLSWETNKLIEDVVFKIESGTDGKYFTEIGTLNGKKGNSNFYFNHNDYLFANNYYRISFSDEHNKILFSNVLSIRNNNITDDYTIYPNPTSGSIYIQGHDQIGNLHIEVNNVLGKSVFNSNLSSSEGEIEIADFEKLTNGVYFIKILNNKGQEFNTKIIKQD